MEGKSTIFFSISYGFSLLRKNIEMMWSAIVEKL